MLEESGASTLEHLITVYQATGEMPPELIKIQSIDCPTECYPIWLAFMDLCSTRSSNGMGPNPISFQELDAYIRLTDNLYDLTADDIDILKQIDVIYLNKVSKKLSKK